MLQFSNFLLEWISTRSPSSCQNRFPSVLNFTNEVAHPTPELWTPNQAQDPAEKHNEVPLLRFEIRPRELCNLTNSFPAFAQPLLFEKGEVGILVILIELCCLIHRYYYHSLCLGMSNTSSITFSLILANTLFPFSNVMDLDSMSNRDAHSNTNSQQGKVGGKTVAWTITTLFTTTDFPSFTCVHDISMSTRPMLVSPTFLALTGSKVFDNMSSQSFWYWLPWGKITSRNRQKQCAPWTLLPPHEKGGEEWHQNQSTSEAWSLSEKFNPLHKLG